MEIQEELQGFVDSIIPQIERQTLASILNKFFELAGEELGKEVRDIKPTDERNLYVKKLNENFKEFLGNGFTELSPQFERAYFCDMLKGNMEAVIAEIEVDD